MGKKKKKGGKKKKKGKRKKKVKEFAPSPYKHKEYKTPRQAAPQIMLTVKLADPPNKLFSFIFCF